MNLVIDASVAAKWFLADSPGEDDAERALAILAGTVACEHVLHQPPHFVAEVAAVLSRLKPDQVQRDIADLLAIRFEQGNSSEIYATAISMAIRYGQHVFDTLYHATAIRSPDAMLVTADRRYFLKAGAAGRICLLSDFEGAGA
ncbi:MAG: type II toxin-antitoxin system VapC family toxin [Burkholderiales bacterium]|nr:type II toxin-antitoxin system VapC family toxin [Burkholderiales bacterium]